MREIFKIVKNQLASKYLRNDSVKGFSKSAKKFKPRIKARIRKNKRIITKNIEDLLFYQNGNSVFKEVCPMVAEFITNQLKDNDIEPKDISKFWLHQANARMVNLIVSKVIGTDDFDTSLAPLPIEKFGNLASAGSMFAFNLHNDLEKGDKGIICSFGAGYSVCSIVVEKQ